MLSLFAKQISCHICGEDEAILVISLKPPAANAFIFCSSLSLVRTILTRETAIMCGTWLMAAVILSCSDGDKTTQFAPVFATNSFNRDKFSNGVSSNGVNK